jgi:hypothetical protein
MKTDIFLSCVLIGVGIAILIAVLPINPLIGMFLTAMGLLCLAGSGVNEMERQDLQAVRVEARPKGKPLDRFRKM